MKALIVSLESFQKGDIPEEVKEYLVSNHGKVFTVLDESSKIKSNEPCADTKKSKRTQAILKLSSFPDMARCILTGTFMSKSPVNAYDQMNFLKEGFFPESMYAFAEKHTIRINLPMKRGARITIPEKDYMKVRSRLLRNAKDPVLYSGAVASVRAEYGLSQDDCLWIARHEKYTPFKNLDELWKRIGDTCFKVSREELFDMPPKVYKTVPLKLTKEQRRLYLRLQEQHCTDRVVVENGLQLYLRFQDICNGYEPVDAGEIIDKEGKIKRLVELEALQENPKIEALKEVLESVGDEQAVIWCSRTRLLYDAKKAAEDAGYKTGVYDGKTGKAQREKDYEAFTRKDIQLLFVNQASGAYGLDGLKQADYAVYLCSSYSVEQRQQSEDRIYRGKVTRTKTIIDITFKGTCEDRVTEALKIGKELLNTGTTSTEVFMLEDGE